MADTAVLEIQDAELRLKRASGEIRVEPGYALVDDAGVLVGARAREAARLRPRDLHTRFWSDLSLDPLARQAPAARTTADLAFAQLSSLWAAAGADIEEVVLAIPAQLSREKLGLLLGIAQECAIPVCGMVGTPLLCALRPEPERRLAYLDAGLHEAVLTQIDQRDGASMAGFDTAAGAGLLAFEERWIQRVAAVFLTQTRFDPLHQGTTEQVLYDQLPNWVETLRREPRVDCRIRFANQSYSCSVGKAELAASGAALCAEIVDLVRRTGGPLALRVSHRLAVIPGLLEALEDLSDVEVVALEAGASLDRALHRIDEIRSPDDGVVLTTRLAWSELPVPARPAPVRDDTPTSLVPTHVVFRGLARELRSDRFEVGAEPGVDLQLPGDVAGLRARHLTLVRRGGALFLECSGDATVLRVGAGSAPDAPLAVGDRIRVGAAGEPGRESPAELLLVALAEPDGA